MLAFSFIYSDARAQFVDSLEKKESQCKINLSLIGIGANYEIRLHKQSTLNFEADIKYGFVYSNSLMYGENWGYILAPVFSTEYRQYYGTRRRIAKHKAIRNNSGNFFSFTVGYKAEPFVNKNMDDSAVFFGEPAWGMQRSWGRRINFESRFGFSLNHVHATAQWEASPSVRLSIGYVIK